FLLHSSLTPLLLSHFPTRRSSDLRPLPTLRRPSRRTCRSSGSHRRRRPRRTCVRRRRPPHLPPGEAQTPPVFRSGACAAWACQLDRKSTRLNSSHVSISYAVFCLK